MKKIILASLLAASVASSVFAAPARSGHAPSGAITTISFTGTCTTAANSKTPCTPPVVTCNYVPPTHGPEGQSATYNCSSATATKPMVSSVAFTTEDNTVTCKPSTATDTSKKWSCAPSTSPAPAAPAAPAQMQ